MRKSFKELFQTRRHTLGTFIQLPCPELVEIFGTAGYDFILIDNEHTGIDISSSVGMVRAAEAVDTCVLIRTADASETRIKKALDTGAAGILVPGVTGVQMTRDIVYFAKYAPDGMRGACPGVRANFFGKGDVSYYAKANREIAVTIQVEGKEAFEEIDGILDVKGLDAILLGPVDLSMALGVPGHVDHPIVIQAMKDMVKKANDKGVKCGTFAMDKKNASMWFDAGMDFIAYHIDAMLIHAAARQAVEEMREYLS